MELIDFSNHQNRLVRLEDVSEDYLTYIHQTTMQDPYYPTYHIAPPHGLLNDPNGLCQMDGVTHIFYQWFPLGPVHGLKHWYHVSTRDYVHYEDHGIALAPEDVFDGHGCYSGMCLKTDQEALMFYTGIADDDSANVCYGKFHDTTIEKKGILIHHDPTITTENFRDPCVIQKEEGFLMMVGGESLDHQGILPIYQGKQLDELHYVGNLTMLEYPFGYMLECPNYFETEGKGVLFFSPQGIQSPNRFDFRNVFSVVYAIGSPISDDLTFDATTFYEMDKGFDFYAPQIFQEESGRYVLYGWLGNSKCVYPSDRNHWAHMLTIPRSIRIEEDQLIQQPLEELHALREEKFQVENQIQLSHLACEVAITTQDPFTLSIANEQGEHISFQMKEDEYELDRTHMSEVYNETYGTIRYAKRQCKDLQTIQIYIDHSSIEIFCDHGKTVFTSRFYIQEANQLHISGCTMCVWTLKPNEISKLSI